MKPRAPLRISAPLLPVIHQTDRVGLHIRGRASPALFWRRLKRARSARRSPLSYLASWSLSIALHQKIVLGRQMPKREARTQPTIGSALMTFARSPAPPQTLYRLALLHTRPIQGIDTLPMRPPAGGSPARWVKRAAPPVAVSGAATPRCVLRANALPIGDRTATQNAWAGRRSPLPHSSRELHRHPHRKQTARHPLSAIRHRKPDRLLDGLAARWTTFTPRAGAPLRLNRGVHATSTRAVPQLRPTPVVNLLYQSRETVVRDRDVSASADRARPPELVWPSAPRPGIQSSFRQPALPALTTVVQGAQPFAAARAPAPTRVPLAKLPELNGLVEEVMRRIEHQVRSERLRRGI